MMSTDWLPKLLESASRFSIPVFVVATVILFIPVDMAEAAGLLQIRLEYRGWLWVALIFAGTFSLRDFAKFLVAKGTTHFENRINGKRAEEERRAGKEKLMLRLNSLSEGERTQIVHCLMENRQSYEATVLGGGPTHLLVDKEIVRKGSEYGNRFSVQFPDEVWGHLRANMYTFITDDERKRYAETAAASKRG